MPIAAFLYPVPVREAMIATYDDRHVFIVRIWLEPRELKGEAPQLRGSVEHVPSGARRSIKALEEVMAFMAQFLPVAQHNGL